MALQDPPPNIQAHPAPNNLLEWHYALEGGKGTEYEGGVYHGKITFPADYPYKPPSIVMLTASGRFAVNTKLCLSMTNFHPGTVLESSKVILINCIQMQLRQMLHMLLTSLTMTDLSDMLFCNCTRLT